MKRLILLFALLSTLAMPIYATGTISAVDAIPQCSDPKLAQTTVCKEVATQKGSNSSPFVKTISIIISVLAFVIGVAAVIGIIVGGLKMVLANGDSNGIAQARSALIYSLIGVVIAAAAQTIVVFVLDKL